MQRSASGILRSLGMTRATIFFCVIPAKDFARRRVSPRETEPEPANYAADEASLRRALTE